MVPDIVVDFAIDRREKADFAADIPKPETGCSRIICGVRHLAEEPNTDLKLSGRRPIFAVKIRLASTTCQPDETGISTVKE